MGENKGKVAKKPHKRGVAVHAVGCDGGKAAYESRILGFVRRFGAALAGKLRNKAGF